MTNQYPWDLWLQAAGQGVLVLTRHEHFEGRLAAFVGAARSAAKTRRLHLHVCIPNVDDRDRVLLYAAVQNISRSTVRETFDRVICELKEAHARNLPADWTRNTRQDA